MIVRDVEAINYNANFYFDRFINEISKDQELNDALTKIDELSKQKDKLPDKNRIEKTLSTISKQVPLKGKVGMLFKLLMWNNKRSAILIESELNGNYKKYQEKIKNSLKTHLNRSEPKYYNTVPKCLGYEEFLLRLKHLPLMIHVETELKAAQERARIRTEAHKDLTAKEYHNEVQKRLDSHHDLLGHGFIALSDKIKKINKDIDENVEITQENLEATRENLKKSQILEEELKQLGIKVDDKLKKLIENSQETHEQLRIVCTYIKNTREEKAFEEKIDGINNAAGFVIELGKFVGNKELSRVGIVAQAGVKIGTSLIAFKSMSGLATLTPIAGIGMAVLSIASAFRSGPDANQMILEAIHTLSIQIDQFRKEMHERLDNIESQLTEMYLHIISGFSEMHYHNKSVNFLLRDIQNDLQQGQVEVKNLFSTLNSKVRTISDRQYSQGRKEKIEKLYKSINKAMGIHTLGASEFKDLYNEFTTDICDLHRTDDLLVGEKSLSSAAMVDRFEADASNIFATEFNIQSIQGLLYSDSEEKSELVNPIVWSWQVIGMMELMKRFYEKKEGAHHSISHAELNTLKKIQSIGEKTDHFSKKLRDSKLLLRLNNNYFSSGQLLKKELIKYIEQEEKVFTKKLNQMLALSIEKYKNDKEIEFQRTTLDAFKDQVIPINIQPVSKWFTGRTSNFHYKWGEKFENRVDDPSNGHIAVKVKSYIRECEQSINQTKESYIGKVRQSQGGYNNAYHYFSHSNLTPHFHYAFAFPQNPDDPILPLPENYKISIPATLQMAEWLNVGRIEFQYRIENSEEIQISPSDKKQNFILEEHFITDDQDKIITTLTIPYNPGVYTNDSKVVTAEDAIKAKAIQREGLWWYWVGGLCSRDGTCSYTTVHSNTTREHNTWRTYAHIPDLKNFIGKRIEIKSHEGKLVNASEKSNMNEDSLFIQSIKEKIHTKNQEYKKLFLTKLEQELVNNNESSLGKALIQYSHAFYLLRSTLSLGYGEENLKQSESFTYFYNPSILSNRAGFLSALKNLVNTDDSLIDLFDKNLKTIEIQLPLAIEQMSDMLLKDSCLAFILNTLKELIDWYALRAVDENQLYNKMAVEDMQREQIETYKGLVDLLKEAVLTTSSSTQKELFLVMEQLSEKKGIGFSNLRTHFLRMITAESSTSSSPKSNIAAEEIKLEKTSTILPFFAPPKNELNNSFTVASVQQKLSLS